jgi:AraC-like DNA-binding protein
MLDMVSGLPTVGDAIGATWLVETYSEPEQIEAAHVGAKAEFVPTAAGKFSAELVRIRFASLWAGRFSESGPRIRHVRQGPDRVFLKFQALPGPEIVKNGAAVPFGSVIRHARGEEFYERTTGPSEWGLMSLPAAGTCSASIALIGSDIAEQREPQVTMPSPADISTLWRLNAAATALAKDAPHVLAMPGAAEGLEQALIEAMVACLTSGDNRDESWAQQCHGTIMRRFHRVLEDNPERAIYLSEICAAIGASERTLRACCQEHLAMGPKLFLTLRRMHMVRRVLRAASPADTTVTEVAARFGFWHFGRFASSYRSTFGESPSVSLRRDQGSAAPLDPSPKA